MHNRLAKKQLRRNLSIVGWSAVINFLILELMVSLSQGVTAAGLGMEMVLGLRQITPEEILQAAMNNAWGYFVAAFISLMVFFGWKGVDFWREEIWARGKPMTLRAFFVITCVYMLAQWLGSWIIYLQDLFFQLFHLDVMGVYDAMESMEDSLSMFLYSNLLAPIWEELFFRGLILRAMRPYGKRFAIFVSAFAFGMYHGNLVQMPYAILVGLVWGYAALEYSLGWCMGLHLFNNLVLSDLLPRFFSVLPEALDYFLEDGILFLFAMMGLYWIVRNRKRIALWLQEHPRNPVALKNFFFCSGTVVFLLFFGAQMVYSLLAFS